MAAVETTLSSRALAFAPRVALALLLAGAAYFIPKLFVHTNPAAQSALEVALLGIAVTALVTPGKALSDAASTVGNAFKPSNK